MYNYVCARLKTYIHFINYIYARTHTYTHTHICTFVVLYSNFYLANTTSCYTRINLNWKNIPSFETPLHASLLCKIYIRELHKKYIG